MKFFEMENKLDMWWRLAVVSAGVNMLSAPAYILFQLGQFFLNEQDQLAQLVHYSYYGHIIVFLIWLFAAPFAYSVVFCIWHWHTRFRGKHPVFWPVFTTLAYPMLVPGAFIIYLTYFFMHVLPDIRGKGAYSRDASIPNVNPLAAPLPANHNFAKSVWLSLGWSFIVIGLIAATTTLIADFVIWNIVLDRIPELVGKPFTKKFAGAFVGFVNINKICVTTSFLCAATTILGAIFLQIGYKKKPSKMDETKKDMECVVASEL